MIQYFLNIFSNISDQARLLLVLITAFITIFVVFINDYLQRKRARKELLTSKIEEMYQAASQYSVLMGKILLILEEARKTTTYPKIDIISSGLADSVENEINKIEMVMKLYFPSHVIALDDFRWSALPIKKVVSSLSISNTSEVAHKNKEVVYEICQGLVNKI
jgi:hypothetical protein